MYFEVNVTGHEKNSGLYNTSLKESPKQVIYDIESYMGNIYDFQPMSYKFY